MAKIIHNKEKCIGCGACSAVCPDNWKLEDDGKAAPKKTNISDKDIECNKEAERVCPVKCIKIKE